MKEKPIIGITMGDAAGIGPEIIVKTLGGREIYRISSPLVIGEKRVIGRELTAQSSRLKINSITRIREAGFKFGTIDLVNLNNIRPERIKIGEVSSIAAKAAVEYIKEALSLAKKREIDAVVTAPLNKDGLHRAGFRFSGHTELFAHLTKTKTYAMMLVGGPLKVVLVTTHLPLSKVSDSLSKAKVYQTIRLTWDNMKYFGVKSPRIGVAGLNPHAGEEGLFGREEKRFIIPAVEEARRKGIKIAGPLPADTIFYRALKGEFDVIVAMYHDQGLIPLKMLAFDKGVNITLGLPIIRTSVDHGTAYGIAGKGKANPQSLMEALRLAVQLVKAKRA